MSRATWTYLFSDKTQVTSLLPAFLTYVNTQFHTSVQVLRSDNGTEFMNKSLASELHKLGIVHQSSCPYSPQQNGIVERKTILGSRIPTGATFLSMIQAKRMLRKGCDGYLAYIVNTQIPYSKIGSIPVVCEFGDVFSEELP